MFANRAFQDLLHSNDTYDLVILESFFGQEALAVLGHKFQAPIIAETSYGTPHNCFLFMGNPNLYAYMPDYKFAFPARMDFLQRLQNTAMGEFGDIIGYMPICFFFGIETPQSFSCSQEAMYPHECIKVL